MAKKQSSKNPYVIIRTYSAGVHAGELVRMEGKEVELKNSRRVWYWTGAASLSELAVNGSKSPETCKISVVVEKIIITEAIEVLFCEKESIRFFKTVLEWKA